MQIDASAKNTTRDSCIVPNPCSESKYAVSKAIPSSPQLSFSKESINVNAGGFFSTKQTFLSFRRRQQ